MSKKKNTQEKAIEISNEVEVVEEIEVLDTDIEVEQEVEVEQDTIVFATPKLEEAWTGEKPVEVVKEIIAGEYEENDLVTFRLKNGNLHFGRYGAIVKMGYKAEGLYEYPKKK